jgi:drug/metabolite transporter (DMT)-like permease
LSALTKTEGRTPVRWYGIVGAVLVLVGAVWLLQGVGLLQGSVMTGQILWVLVGAVALILGAALVYLGIPRREGASRV